MSCPTTKKCFLEFFAGIGLVHEALRKSGWECVYANDIDPKKESMYKGQFGESPYFHLEDIWQTDRIVSEIPGAPFLATASFPCTDLSLAGHWRGFEGAQSSTYFGFMEALKALGDRRPKVVMLENVPGFLTSKGGADFETAVRTLAAEGYWIDCVLVDAKWFVPQSRARVFVIGMHESLNSGLVTRQSTTTLGLADPWRSAIEAGGILRPEVIQRLMARTTLTTGWAAFNLCAPKQAKYALSAVIDTDDDQEWWDDAATAKHYSMLSDLHRNEVERRRREGGLHVGTVYRRCRNEIMRAEVRFDNIAGCLRTPRGGSARQIVMVIDSGKVRFRWMSPREYARLQGAPRFKLAPNTVQSLFGFGDGVCVPVIRWLDRNILTPLFDEHTNGSSQTRGTRGSKRISA